MTTAMAFSSFDVLYYALFFLASFLIFRILMSKRNGPKFPPGPMALPIIGHLHLLGPLLHQALHKLSARYGPFFYLRLGSIDAIVASTPDTAKEFLKTHDSIFCNRPEQNTAIDYLTFDVAKTLKPYGPVWIYIKKISFSELLGSHSVHKYRSIRNNELHNLLGQIASKAKAGEMANVTSEVFKLTNNIISQAILSKRVSDMGGEDPTKLVREVIQELGAFYIADFIGFFKHFDVQGFKKKLVSTRNRFGVVVEKIVKERELERKQRKRDGRLKDFLDVLLDSTEDTSELKLSRDHAKALLLEYLTAGTDSTGVAIEWTLAELINNPRVMKKAREEINRVVGNRLVEEEDTPKLPYIEAIIKESLRLHPPVPIILRSSNRDSKVRGYTLPSGTVAVVNLYSVGRCPEAWKDPLDFKPERFMDGGGKSFDMSGNYFQFLPFGSGRRYCTGMAFAMQVLPVTVAALVQCFDWQVDKEPGMEGKFLDLTEKPGFTIGPLNDIVCYPRVLLNPPNLG